MKKKDWYSILPPDLLQIAYKSTSELAWPKEQALKVIDILEANGLVASGVDIWIPTNPGPTIPTPIVYDWGLKSLPRKDFAPDTAKEFIETFSWDAIDKSHKGFDPVFNLSAKPKNVAT